MKRIILTARLAGMVIFFLSSTANAAPILNPDNTLVIIEPGPIRKSTLYVDGSIIEVPTETKIWPIIGSNLTDITLDEFKAMVESHRQAFADNPNKITVSPGTRDRGPNVIFIISNPPPGATEALDSVAAYLERTFDDTITFEVEIAFSPMGGNVLGWCSSSFTLVTWNNLRNGLVNDTDSDDTVQVWLPSGSTIPVRYVYGSSTVTDEDRCYVTYANYKAAIGTISGVAAHIEFNTNFSWDYDPSDGLSGTCFQSVAVHEMGHCLGFTSGTDRTNDIETLDIYRFQRSDDGGDYNPDTYAEFQTTARLVDQDYGTADDDVNSDIIIDEYRMSDGSPWQSSHFSQDNVYALMQPAIGSGQTYYPYFYKIPDRLMFDAIGWDYLLSYALTIHCVGGGSVTKSPDQYTYLPETEVEVLATPDQGWEFTGWGGALSGNNNPDTVVMDTDKEVYANFTSLYCTLTVYIIGSGSVLKDPDLPIYPRDTPVELTAVPDSGWAFNHWSGNLWGSHNPDTIIMNSDKTVTAHFLEEQAVEELTNELRFETSLDVLPNPFRDNLSITLTLSPNAHNLKLKIYDIAGRVVHVFPVSQLATSSINHIVWGIDQNDRRLPRGVYILMFNCSEFKAVKKLLWLE